MRPRLLLAGLSVLLTAGLLWYSQTLAFAYDEGFHLVAAQLILLGRRPYLDFFFPQTPLNAYWNAGLFVLFGETWRTAHVASALLSASAVALMTDYVWRRFPVPAWRLAAAVTTFVCFGLSSTVVMYGTLSQAYGFCVFLMVAAFRLAVSAAGRKGIWLAGAAGCVAAAAPAGSLLSAPVLPVLGLWLLVCNRTGNRWAKAVTFSAAAAIPFSPVIWLAWQSARHVRFDVLEFHMKYRMNAWEGAMEHDIGVWFSWLDSSQALVLGLLALAGLVYLLVRGGWDKTVRAEFFLCFWLALAEAVHISTAHPTFSRYYILTIPFLSVLAAAGFFAVASRLYSPVKPALPVAVLSFLIGLGLANTLGRTFDDFRWRDWEAVGALVAKTPAGPMMAEEAVYFVTQRVPPEGMESHDTNKLDTMPVEVARPLHVVPEPELRRRLRGGEFVVVEQCQEDYIKELDLPSLYVNREKTADDCEVFWGFKKP